MKKQKNGFWVTGSATTYFPNFTVVSQFGNKNARGWYWSEREFDQVANSPCSFQNMEEFL